MTRASLSLPTIAIGLLLIAGPMSCKNASTSAPSAGTDSDLPAIAPPDVARMEPSVQRQLEDQYRSLTAAIGNRATSPSDLANAYGTMGNLLLAVDHADAAEPFYVHAESLAPGEMRWPYYLGHVYMAKAEPAK